MKIASGVLTLVTVFFSFKHGWAGLTMKPDESVMFKALGVSKGLVYVLSSLTIVVGVLVLFHYTFFAGNVLNTALILVMMMLQLRARNLKAALIEIPFLLMPWRSSGWGIPYRNKIFLTLFGLIINNIDFRIAIDY